MTFPACPNGSFLWDARAPKGGSGTGRLKASSLSPAALFENHLVDKQKLRTLKNLLKTNQGLTFDESRTNDKFIKHFSADQNLLFFVRQRYKNQVNVKETTNPKLPEGWKVKNINGVEYFKTEDENGFWVFYNRRLVVDFLRQNNSSMSQAEMIDFLEESDPESELSDNEDMGEGSC